jgi:hypothetical protein
MWGLIIQIITLFGGGIAVGTMLEEKGNQPVIIHQAPTIPAPAPTPVALPPAAPEVSGAFNPFVLIAIAILVLAAGYMIRSIRKL